MIINENLDYKESESRKIVCPIASVPNIGIEKKAQLESKALERLLSSALLELKNSELKTISDHKKQVFQKVTVKTYLY